MSWFSTVHTSLMKALILKDFYVKVGDHDQVIRALVKLPLSSDFFCIPYKKTKKKLKKELKPCSSRIE